jgi:hypothetical protein
VNTALQSVAVVAGSKANDEPRGNDRLAGPVTRANNPKIQSERPTELVITVSPTGSPGRFRAVLAGTGELQVGSSRQPFMDAARVLIENGRDPGAVLVMKHAGTDAVALWARLGTAAQLTVEEGDRIPRFRRWKALLDAAGTPWSGFCEESNREAREAPSASTAAPSHNAGTSGHGAAERAGEPASADADLGNGGDR